MLNFQAVEEAIAQTKVEVVEHEAASGALEAAKAEAAAVQLQVVEANAQVAAAAEESSKQKADVVAGINAAIASLQELLAQI